MPKLKNREPMVVVALRIPKHVLDHYRQLGNPTVKMREVLSKEVGQSKKL
jgi:uncharacterized protein (DUF4415 family)